MVPVRSEGDARAVVYELLRHSEKRAAREGEVMLGEDLLGYVAGGDDEGGDGTKVEEDERAILI